MIAGLRLLGDDLVGSGNDGVGNGGDSGVDSLDGVLKILGGGLTTIDLYLMPDEYDVKLEIDLLATDATWNFAYNDTGKEFLKTGTYNAYTDSGTGKVYVGYAKRQVMSKQIVDLPKSGHELAVQMPDGTIQNTDLNEYLWGVVAAEMPASPPPTTITS